MINKILQLEFNEWVQWFSKSSLRVTSVEEKESLGQTKINVKVPVMERRFIKVIFANFIRSPWF